MNKLFLLFFFVFVLPLVFSEEFSAHGSVQFLLVPSESMWVDFVMPFDSFAMPVQELVRQNPQIRGIIYYDSTLQRYIPYFNIGRGVGMRFIVEPGRGYKVLVRETTLLQVDGVSG